MKQLVLLLIVILGAVSIIVPHGTIPTVHATNSSTSPGFFTNMVWITMENHNATDVANFKSGNSTYQSNLNNTWASATRLDYESISGSLPNYIAGIAGYLAFGSSCDSAPATCGTTSSETLVDDMTSNGLTWKGYMEGMSSSNICSGGGASDGGTKYIAHHNPFVYFTGITGVSSQCQLVVPAGTWAGTGSPCNAIVSAGQAGIVSTLLTDLGTAGTAPNLMYVVPNNCDNSHDGSTTGDQIGTGNSWLSAVVPKILQTSTFTDPSHRSIILITYDEGRDFDCCLNRDNLYTVIIGPGAKNAYTTGTSFNHYSIDKTVEQNWGLPIINASNTNDLNANTMTGMLVPNNGLGTTSENNQFGWPGGMESFYAQGRYWLFYVTQQVNCEGFYLGDCIQYTSSTDGTNWSQVINSNFTATDPNHAGDYAVATNTTHVFRVRANSTVTSNMNNVIFRIGKLAIAGTITWQTETVIKTNTTAGEDFYGLSIAIATTGRIFVAYVDCATNCQGTPSSSSHVIYADAPYTSWTGDTQLVCSGTIDGSCPASGNSFVRNILSPQTGGKIGYIGASGSSGLRGKLWTGTAWTDQGSVSNPNGLSPQCSGFTNVFTGLNAGGDITTIFWPPTTADRMCYNITIGGTWQTSQVFFNFDPCTVGVLYLCYSVTFDTNTNNFYMAAYYQSQSKITLYQGPSPASWKNATLTTTGTATSSNFIRTPQLSVTLNATKFAIPVWWTDASGAPFQVHYTVSNQAVPIIPTGGSQPAPVTGASQPVPFQFHSTTLSVFGFNLTIPIELVSQNTVLIAVVVTMSVLLSSVIQVPVQAQRTKNKMSPQEIRMLSALVTSIITVALDFTFHLTLTEPMEVPFYFIAKLVVAFLVGYYLVPKWGKLKSAMAFTFSFDVYYGLGVLLLHIPWLSSSPTQIIEIAGFGSQCLGYNACDLITEGTLLLVWTAAHGLFFLAGAEIASKLVGPIALRTRTQRKISLV